jgi:hypothetical protein
MQTKSILIVAVAVFLIAFGIPQLPDAEAEFGSDTGFSLPAIARGGMAFTSNSGYAYGQWVNSYIFSEPGGRVVGVGDLAPTGTFTSFGPARISGNRPLFPSPGSGVPSDFNNNGVVDAADYVLWRNGGPLPFYNDATFGWHPEDYDAWRASFGNSINPQDTTTVAFHATYDDPPKTGVFAKRGGQLITIAKVGDTVPSTTSTLEGLGSDVAISETTIAFGASYAGGTQGIFTGSGGPLTTIAKTGDMTSVGPLASFSFAPAISGNTVAFAASVGDGSTKGIFTGSGGELTTVVMTGDPAPVGVFTSFDEYGLSMGSGGKVAFRATYDDGNKTGIFTGDGGDLTTVVQTGDDVPGVGTITSLSTLSMSGNKVAFYATWSGGKGFLSQSGAGPVELFAGIYSDPHYGPFDISMGRFGFDGNRVAYSYRVPFHAPYRIDTIGSHSPEPASLITLIFALVSLGGCTRWRRPRTPANAAIVAYRQSESNRSWLATPLLCVGLLVILVVGRPVQADLIHASAYLGNTGVTSPSSQSWLSDNSYLGSRFSVASVTEIESVGGHIRGLSGEIFAAIVSLQGPIALPSGSPFDDTTVASTVFTAPTPSDDILVPLPVTLQPGDYALIFGSGQFGAEGSGGMPTNNVDFPGRASYFKWPGNYNQYWSFYNGGGLRFVVMGTAEPAPPPPFQSTVLQAPGFGNIYANGNSESGQVAVGNTGAPGPSDRHALLWTGTAGEVIDLHPAGFNYSEATAIDGDVQVGNAFNSPTGEDSHAMLWHGSAESAVDLHPAQFRDSYVRGISGNSQVGVGGLSDGSAHALLWHGTADSFVDLHPPEFQSSEARAISENSQVGSGWTNYPVGHALLWHGTAESAVDLHPIGFNSSSATAVSGNAQVGSGEAADGQTHALLWHGSAESVVDLHPASYSSSSADFIAGETQIGSGKSVDGRSHALLWRGTAESVVDLNPAGFEESDVNDVSENHQVGTATAIYGRYSEERRTTHAMYWNGTAESAIDLHQYLPVPGADYSSAVSIAPNGDILGNFNYFTGDYSHSFAVLWKVVTEPVTGDYDENGTVDAADYVVWRNTLGDTGTGLAADGNNNGQIEAGDYDVWRAHFGQTATNTIVATSNFSEAIPEPSSILLLIPALIGIAFFQGQKRIRNRLLHASSVFLVSNGESNDINDI